MSLHSCIFLAGILSHLPLQAGAAADITLGGVELEGGYVVSTTPTAVKIKTTHTQAVTTARSIVYTFDTALFGPSAFGQSCTYTAAGVTATFTCAISADGMTLTATLITGSVPAGSTFELAVSSPLVLLPSGEGAVTLNSIVANSGQDTLDGGARAVFYLIGAPTITLTTASMNAGTQPTQLQITVKTPFAIDPATINANTALSIVSSKSVFVSGQSTGLTSVGATFSSHSIASASEALATFDTTTHTAGIAVDQTISLTFASNLLATLPNSAGAVTMSIAVGSQSLSVDAPGFGTIIASVSPGAVGADPVANLGTVRRAFELPLFTLTPLLNSPDLVIHGSVFPGDETEQWFDRVVITTPDESRWMEVKVKKDLEHLNISRVPDSVFSTLDVSLGYGSIAEPMIKTELHRLDQKIPFSFLDQNILFRKMHRLSNIRFPVVGGIRRECVDMAGTFLHLFLCAAPAHEYYGPLHHLSLRYMHLDLAFIEVRDYNELTGLLPELWGTQPITKATQAYVKEEKKQEGENSTALVGGLGIEEIRERCMDRFYTAKLQVFGDEMNDGVTPAVPPNEGSSL